MQTTQKMTEDVTYIGCSDRLMDRFENMYPIPNGMTYNSFFIDDEKTAVLDSSDSSTTQQFLENLDYVLDGRDLDYLVINHMEPDHCANVVELVKRYPKIGLVANKQSLRFIKQFFPEVDLSANYHEVKEGDTLSLGTHELTFYFAPMVHWPEVMFTYDKQDKILFSADAFGAFGALQGNLFVDEVDYDHEYFSEMRRYYANICGKYGMQVKMAMDKLEGVEIKYIATLHGPIWRKDLDLILDKYKLWRDYIPEKKGVVLAYGSVYGHTASAVQYLASVLSEMGVEDLRVYDVSKTHASYIISDIFKYSNVVIASATYNLNIYPPMQAFLDEMSQLEIKNRKVSLIGTGSWAPMAAKLLPKFTAEKLKAWEQVGDTMTVLTSLTEAQKAEVQKLAQQIVDSMQEGGK